MNAEECIPSVTSTRPFIISRVFDAPRDLVWNVWTDSEQMQWWGPKGVTIVHAKLDLRPGGIFHYCMRTPDNSEMWGKWEIREIARPDRLVFVTSFSDAAGGLTRHPLSPDCPLELLTTVTFAAQDNKTLLTIEWRPLNPTAVERQTFDAGHESMQNGWTGTLDRLAAYLAER